MFREMLFQLQLPTVGEVPNFSSITSYAAGTAGDLAGTMATDGGTYADGWWSWIYCRWPIRLRNHGDRLMTRLQEAVILGLTLGVFHGMMQPARICALWCLTSHRAQ